MCEHNSAKRLYSHFRNEIIFEAWPRAATPYLLAMLNPLRSAACGRFSYPFAVLNRARMNFDFIKLRYSKCSQSLSKKHN